jgi:hypothetical protein
MEFRLRHSVAYLDVNIGHSVRSGYEKLGIEIDKSGNFVE